MNTEIVTDLSECRRLWEKFRKDTNIWTEWELVLSFLDLKLHKPHFILIKDDGAEVGLLTLWLDLRDNKYTHFGGERMENRTLWVDKKYYSFIYDAIPHQTYLFDVNGKQVDEIASITPKFGELISERDTRYHLDLKKTATLDALFERFSKKHKKNLLRDLKMLESLNYKLVWTHSNHIDKFIELSKARFEEESDFNDEDNKKEMDRFTSLLEKKGMLHTLLIEINGKVEGAELAALYNNHYYVINGGYNPEIRNLGKLLIIEHIKKSLELGAETIDFLVGDSGWKELWNLDKQEVCSIIKD